MHLPFVKLHEIINSPEKIDKASDFIELDKSECPPVLIYGQDLGLKALQSKDTLPVNFLEQFQAIANQIRPFPISLDAHSAYFKNTPLFLSGEEHIQSRNFIGEFYENIEFTIGAWLPLFTKKFLSEYENKDLINPIDLCKNYVHEVIKNIIATHLSILPSEISDFPESILTISPNLKTIEVSEEKLKKLITLFQSKLNLLNRDPKEAWALASIIIMGTETVSSALMFGLSEPGDLKDTKILIKKSSPVSVVFRKAARDTTIGHVNFKKGQHIYIALHLMNEIRKEDSLEESKQYFSFGKAAHMCPGQKLSLNIIKIFFQEWFHLGLNEKKLEEIRFRRDIVLKPTLLD
jgi:hypothetical protein